MAGFFKNAEDIVKRISHSGLDVVLHYYGIDIELHRQTKDVYTDVYGKHAGSKEQFVKLFTGIVVSDDFFVASDAHAGNFESGFLYTQELEIRVGDIISIKSDDKRSRRHKVTLKESIGTQANVFQRYVLSSLGD